MRIANLKVRTKLFLLVAVGCIGMLLVGVIGLTGMEKAGLLIFCLGILVFVGFYVTVSITKSLKSILDVLQRIADGDLSTQLKIYANDEIGELGKSINRMQTSVGAMIASVKDTASQVDIIRNHAEYGIRTDRLQFGRGGGPDRHSFHRQ